MADPISPIVDKLKLLAVPQSSGRSDDPASWKAGPAKVGNLPVVQAIQALMSALYSTPTHMKDVGTAVTTALTDVAKVVSAIADQVAALPSLSDVANAMDQLQQALVLAQTLAPTGPVAVLDSAGKLFTQIHDLLSPQGQTQTKAAIELYQLAQQLNKIADEIGFPPKP